MWEQRRDQLKVSWRALRARLDAYTAAAGQQAAAAAAATPGRGGLGTPISTGGLGRHASPGLHKTPGGGSSPFLGVPALAAGRAQARRQVTKPPQGLVNPGQLEKLKEMLAVQNKVIAQAREKLAGLVEELDGFRLEHPEVELPGKLRSSVVL